MGRLTRLTLALAVLVGPWLAGDRQRPSAPVAAAAPTLSDLRTDPLRWLGRELGITLQLASAEGDWEPWISRFGRDDYRRLTCWCDSQLPWYREVFDDPVPYLFVRRGTTAEFVLAHARPHERFDATVVVREVLLGEPWIEVLTLERRRPSIGEGAVLHASKALILAAGEGVELAISEAERALASPLPPHAVEDLEQHLGRWRGLLGE